MNTHQLEMAIDQGQWLVRRLTEAHTLRKHGRHAEADRAEKSARISLEDVADSLGFCLVTKEQALADADRRRDAARKTESA